MTQATTIPVVAPPDANTRSPAIALPPLSCDCHAHVCGPDSKYPYFAGRIYTPPEATTSAHYRRMLGKLGIERAVLVQPSFYGSDNSALLDAIAAAGSAYRGVGVLADDASDAQLQSLHERGIRGARVNIVDVASDKGVLPIERLRALGKRIAPLGWHLELLMHVDEFPDLDIAFANFPTPLVFGHLGYVKTERGVDAAGFQALLRLMRAGQAWVKLTGPYRISGIAMPHGDTNVFAAALLDAAPGRLVWGTDWPHVMTRWNIAMPNDADFVDLLARWVPDAGQRKRVLVDNPAQLYGFK